MEQGQKTEYAFCESALATSTSYWHIRKLDDKGLKLGGGITTSSLCDRVMPYSREGIGGWDLRVSVASFLDSVPNPRTVCPTCLVKYREELASGTTPVQEDGK